MGATLLDLHDALLLDLDGVVYVGPRAVEHAVLALRAAAGSGVRTAYVTNNAARPPDVVAEHLRALGLDVEPHDVVTSAQAGAREVAALVRAGSRVLAVGGPGVGIALEARGLVPVVSADDAPVAVLMGYGPDVGWRQLAEASYAVAAGAVLVATNLDLSIPTDRGVAPGNGTLVGAVTAATGVAPAVVAGKPYPPLMLESVERVGAARPLVVGDRLDTDIEGGARSGLPTLLVLTGVHGVADLLAAPPGRRPTYLAADLRGLALPASGLALAADGGPAAGDGPDGLGALRRAAAAAWAAADAGDPAPPVDVAALEALVAGALASA
jgi:glycerol 3-phosphatase-2